MYAPLKRISSPGAMASWGLVGLCQEDGKPSCCTKDEGDPSEPPPCRGRLQTAISCYGPMAAVVNVMVKRARL